MCEKLIKPTNLRETHWSCVEWVLFLVQNIPALIIKASLGSPAATWWLFKTLKRQHSPQYCKLQSNPSLFIFITDNGVPLYMFPPLSDSVLNYVLFEMSSCQNQVVWGQWCHPCFGNRLFQAVALFKCSLLCISWVHVAAGCVWVKCLQIRSQIPGWFYTQVMSLWDWWFNLY